MSNNDLFEMEHFGRASYERKVTRPGFKDVTERLRSSRRGSYLGQIPETTKYLHFVDPERRVSFPVEPGQRDSYKRILSEVVRSLEETEGSTGLLDKVEQRRLCERAEIFRNARYLDIRRVFTDSSAPVTYDFVPETFEGFPIDEIIDNIGERHSYILENMTHGFRVLTSKKGISITGRSDLVKEVSAETASIRDPRERLETFLNRLCERGYTLRKSGSGRIGIDQREKVVDAIMNHPNNLYIKDARSGGGYLVVRVRRDGEETILESDSEEFEQMLEEMRGEYGRAERMIEAFGGFGEANCDDGEESKQGILSVNRDKKRRCDVNNPRRVLEYMLGSLNPWSDRWIENPIIEEEMPYELVEGNRVELRMICQRVDGRFVVTDYAKVSNNSVSANISLGGNGEFTDIVVEKILKRRMQGYDTDKLYGVMDELKDRTERFAEAVYEHNSSLEMYAERRVPMDFAIDLLPIWDKEKGELDFGFLEINYSYGFKGLVENEPIVAIFVRANKSRLG